MEKSKRDSILQGIAFSVGMAVIFFLIMSSMLENKFQNAYKKGYDEGKKHCFDFIRNIPDDDNITPVINYTFSINAS